MSSEPPVDLEMMNAAFRDFVPHNKELGLTVIAAKFEKPSQVTLELKWDERLVGNPFTGVLHGGAITTLLDGACGAAVYVHMQNATPIATLDLRVDFLSRAPTKNDVRAIAECTHVTESVAFVRARAFIVGAEEKPFALASATFAIGTQGRPISESDWKVAKP